MGRALWLPDKLREYGVKVVEVAGWQTRGSSTFEPRGLVCHHTASSISGGNTAALGICINGRSDLPGPLCQVLLARDGTAYVVASGRANHAGDGGWRGLSGNTSVLGIEAENNGVGESWSRSYDAYVATAAALADGANFNVDMICGHKEWTSRKIDPAGIDMNEFRSDVRNNEGGWLMGAKEDIINEINKVKKEVRDSEARTRELLRKGGLVPAAGHEQNDTWVETKLKSIEAAVTK